MPPVLAVRGLKELTKTFSKAPLDVKRAYRQELRTIAEPVQRTAETLAITKIRRMADSPQWAKMRIGVTQRLVYVAPRQRGVKSSARAGRRRRNLAGLLADRVLEPALERNRSRVEADFERMLDRLLTKWDNDGP